MHPDYIELGAVFFDCVRHKAHSPSAVYEASFESGNKTVTVSDHGLMDLRLKMSSDRLTVVVDEGSFDMLTVVVVDECFFDKLTVVVVKSFFDKMTVVVVKRFTRWLLNSSVRLDSGC